MAPDTPAVRAILEERFAKRAKIKYETEPPEKYRKWHETLAPQPIGIPPSIIEAEIANPGSTGIRVCLNDKGDVITVIPRKS